LPIRVAARRASARASIPAHEIFPIAEQDWVRQTQAQFSPIEIARGFWIVPSWSAVPDPDALNLRLDPGLAFGTGSHPTTRLCLEWLREHLGGGESVLDYGCGSGILAIAAAKLGADRVMGIDVDPQAVRASTHNARENNVDAAFVEPDALPAATYEVVIANILANPLIVLAPAIAQRVVAGGASCCRAFSSRRRIQLSPPTRAGLHSRGGGRAKDGFCWQGSACESQVLQRGAETQRNANSPIFSASLRLFVRARRWP
jgi:SAM-dependent methyltransferase